MQSTLYSSLFCGSDFPSHVSNVINIAYFVWKIGAQSPAYAKNFHGVTKSILSTNALNALHIVPIQWIKKEIFSNLK